MGPNARVQSTSPPNAFPNDRVRSPPVRCQRNVLAGRTAGNPPAVASPRKQTQDHAIAIWREWDGRAALPPATALRVRGGCQEKEHHQPHESTVHAVTAIGIDMGKNILHMVGLDSRGAIVLREKVSRGRVASRLANLQPCSLVSKQEWRQTMLLASRRAGHDVKQVPPDRMKADGYTLLVSTDHVASSPHAFKLNIDPLKDLAPVIQLSRQPVVLAVHLPLA